MGTWVNDNGPQRARRFWEIGGRLYAQQWTGGANDGLYERTGAGVWTYHNVGLPAGAEDVCYHNGAWWCCVLANGLYRATDPALGWTQVWASPVGHNLRVINGYGSYLYGVAGEIVGMIESTIHFLRYSTAAEYDFIAAYPNPNPWPNSLDPYDFLEYDSTLWLSMNEQGTGYVFRYWDGAAWADYTTNLEAGKFTHVTGEGTYFLSATLDAVYRNAGAGWSLRYTCGDDVNLIRISQGDYLGFGAEIDAANIQAYVKAGYWQPVLASCADTWGGACVESDGTVYLGGNANVWRYVPDFDVTPVGGGLYPEALDVDGDGDSLYICLYDGAGQPILVKAPLPLAATTVGSAVFNPGAGSAINVKCTNVGRRLAVSGNFGANEQVEVSADGGLTWTDIDPGTWGADVAQPMWVSPDSEGEIMVALATAQDLVETFNQGQDWVTENAALGLSPDSMAKLPLGDEIILGGAGPTVLYSPNRGTTAANITGAIGGAGSVVALEVV